MVGESAPYTIANLVDVEDLAVKHGYSEYGEARFAREALGADQVGVSHQRLRPGSRQALAHRHRTAEEVYVVLSGGGRVKLDDAVREVRALDAIRVSPGVTRAFEAGDDGLELLVFGPHAPGDAEMVSDFWPA